MPRTPLRISGKSYRNMSVDVIVWQGGNGPHSPQTREGV